MDHILFAGPWMKEPGTVEHRVVLHARCEHDKPVEFIVHDQVKPCKGNSGGYDCGNYYPIHYENAFTKALEKFFQRCRDKYGEHSVQYFTGLEGPDDAFLATLASNPNEA